MSIADRERLLNRIRDAVVWSGLSHTEIGRRAQTSQALISKYVAAGSSTWPSSQILVHLPGALDISGHWLLTEEGAPTPPDLGGADIFERGRIAGWREAVESLRGLSGLVSLTSASEGVFPPEILALARRLIDAADTQSGGQPRGQPPNDEVKG